MLPLHEWLHAMKSTVLWLPVVGSCFSALTGLANQTTLDLTPTNVTITQTQTTTTPRRFRAKPRRWHRAPDEGSYVTLRAIPVNIARKEYKVAFTDCGDNNWTWP